MYNEERKNRFIEYRSGESEHVKRVTKSIFRKMAPFEEMYGRDFCHFDSKQEVLDALSVLCGSKVNEFRVITSILGSYNKWCKEYEHENNVSGILNEITFDEVGLEFIKNNYVANTKDLQDCMDIIFDAESNNSMDCVFRAFIWMAYMGIPEIQTIQIPNSAVNLKKQIVQFENKEYTIPDLALKCFDQCLNLRGFQVYNANYKIESGYRERVSGDRILRRSSVASTTDDEIASFRVRISRKVYSADTMRNITYAHVKESGFFYRLLERERLGFPIVFKEVAELVAQDRRGYQGQPIDNKYRSKFNRLARDLEKEYDRWKKAFY